MTEIPDLEDSARGVNPVSQDDADSADDQPLTIAYLKAHPAWQYVCQQYEASRTATQEPAAPDADPTAPEMPKPGESDQSQSADSATMQELRAPLTYQARLAALEGRVQSLEQGNTDLAAKLARKECEFLVYQLQLEGMKALAKPEDAAKLVDRLAETPAAGRQVYIAEIRSCWEKDANISYAMLGAPVGPMVPISASPAEGGSGRPISERQLDVALRYMREHACGWAEAEQYARSNHH